MGIITIENLTKRYGRRVGVADLSLEVPEGSIFGFLGPNGSGKTTTIRVLLGLLRPTAGTARIFGMNCVQEGHRIKAEVGYLPGDLRLYSWMTAESALRLISRIRGRDLSQEGRRLIDVFGLDPAVRVRNMSRGMRQKLGLILALAHRPQLLILDEPTASLDPLMQAKLYRELRALALQGHSVFLSSHTLSEVSEVLEMITAGQKTLVLLIPSRWLWVGSETSKHTERRIHEELVAMLHARGLEVLDLRIAFEETGDPVELYFKKDPHWNREGHQKAAEAIAKKYTG